MNHPLVELLQKNKKRVIGLMSGTSLDGIDAALVEIEGHSGDARVRLVDFRTFLYDENDRARIHALFDARTPEICDANFWLGEKFAAAARALGEADLIGSHGQTVWHNPPSRAQGTPSTLQLGEPALIAARTGVVTVGDFRVADVALGGEGAPLVPYADWVLFRRAERTRALQNIGGIANVTVVGERLDEVFAFDNGPGNVMLDALAPLASQGKDSIDRDGTWSAKGRVQDDLLAQLLDDEYLRQAPPKSTGRERYGREATLKWAAAHSDRAPCDLLATLAEFTARAIADSYRAFLPRLDEVVVSGGGAHNPTLMGALARLIAPLPLAKLDEGVGVDAKEAVAFALFAVEALHGARVGLPRVTGAARAAVLGKICLP